MKLLETFADQAVIAIENVRLFKELTEALEQQTATSEILGVIASSPTDIQPVLDVVAQNAARLCEANDALIYRETEGYAHRVAQFGTIPVSMDRLPISRGFVGGRAMIDRRTIHVHDVLAEIDTEFPEARTLQQAAGARTVLSTPLLRQGEAIGSIVIRRTEVRPFTDKHIKLLETFADQAVIAIENVRLFQELKESLEQQTATSEILGVIASSPTDVQPVLDVVAENAARLCDATDAVIHRIDGDKLRSGARYGLLPTRRGSEPLTSIDRGSIPGRTVIDRRTLHIHDLAAEPEDDLLAPFARSLGVRTVLATPLLREGIPIGTIHIRRMEVRPFTEKQIKLLETFAAQAVIAIENVRLFKELQERNRQITEALEQQTATSEILRVIASSPTDIQPVLDTSRGKCCKTVRSDGRCNSAAVDGERIQTSRTIRSDAGAASRNRINRDSIPQLDGPWLIRRTVHVHDLAAEIETEYSGVDRASKSFWHSHYARHAAASRRHSHRHDQYSPHGGAPVLREACSSFWKPSPTRPSSPSRTCVCSRNWKRGRASWRDQWAN